MLSRPSLPFYIIFTILFTTYISQKQAYMEKKKKKKQAYMSIWNCTKE